MQRGVPQTPEQRLRHRKMVGVMTGILVVFAVGAVVLPTVFLEKNPPKPQPPSNYSASMWKNMDNTIKKNKQSQSNKQDSD